jgi:hypothetical protein
MDNNDGPDDQFDAAFEREIQDSTVWVGDGYFIDQSWVSLGETKPVEPEEERLLVLHTCWRHPLGHEKAGRSFAHDHHPFVAFVHLLDIALPVSDVFMSIQFLGDFNVIDQLCHYASPQYSTFFWVLSTGVGKLWKNSLAAANLEKRRLSVSTSNLLAMIIMHQPQHIPIRKQWYLPLGR